MLKADEKEAFDNMMAEIEGDSDEEVNYRPAPTKGYTNVNNNSHNSNTTNSNNNQRNEYNLQQSKSSSNYDEKRTGYEKKSEQTSNYLKIESIAMSKPSTANSKMSNKLSKEDAEIENFGYETSQLPSHQQSLVSEQIMTTKRWLTRPYGKNERASMKCFIEREKSSFGLQTVYRCYLENSLEGFSHLASNNSSSLAQHPSAKFMMAAKKKVTNKTSYYLVSLDINPDDRGSETVLGKVRGNAIGSRYLIVDHGLAPEKTVAPSMLRKEYGAINFEFDSGGPSKIEAWLPYVNQNGTMNTWQPRNESQGIEAAIDRGELDQIIYLQNKAPKWDKAHGGHVLNFQGRVTESSVKNFQLCCINPEFNPEDITLQFGRVGKNRFTMDISFPLSPLQAFSICVACLDGKIADRKGYEYIKKLAGVNGSDNPSTASSSSSSQPLSSNASSEAVSRNSDLLQPVAEGSMSGNSSSLTERIRDVIPSGQYLKDKISRSFK